MDEASLRFKNQASEEVLITPLALEEHNKIKLHENELQFFSLPIYKDRKEIIICKLVITHRLLHTR